MNSQSGDDRRGGVDDGRPFDLRAVEHQLALLWQSDSAPGEQRDTVRACSINLVIPIGPDGYSQWQERIAALSQRVPSRIILCELSDRVDGGPLAANVFATCHRRKEGVLICSEVIHIEALPQAARLTPSICRALAVSDLPLCLLAVEAGQIEQAAQSGLDALADLVIGDSVAAGAPALAVGARTEIGDLAWSRLRPWRAALGHFLKSCTLYDPLALTRVRLVGELPAVRLYTGWLGFLLGWEQSSRGESCLHVHGSDRPIELCCEENGETQGGLAQVELFTHDDRSGVVRIAPVSPTRFRVEARLGPHRIDSEVALRKSGFAEQVAGIVHSHGADQLYRRSSALAASLFGETADRR